MERLTTVMAVLMACASGVFSALAFSGTAPGAINPAIAFGILTVIILIMDVVFRTRKDGR